MRQLGFGLTFLVIAGAQVGAALIAAGVADAASIGIPLTIVGLIVAFGASYLIIAEPGGDAGRRVAQVTVFRWCLLAALVGSLLMILFGALFASPVPFVIGAILTVGSYIAFLVLGRMAK